MMNWLFYHIYMELNGKRVNLYRGMWAAILTMIVVPAIAFAIIFGVIYRFFAHPFNVTLYISLGFGGAVGALFVFSMFFSRVSEGLYDSIGDRIRETKEMFGGIFKKDGFKWYMTRFVEDGGIILIVLAVFTLIYAGISIYGFVQFGSWYNSVGSSRDVVVN